MQETAPQPSPSALPQEELSTISSAEKQELVQRVLKSSPFSRSTAMRTFLLYITENALAHRYDLIKEQSIGSSVLGRKPDYNPAEDNIVRVRAHELRKRLALFFSTEGAGERYVIVVPKGTYKPEFVLRESAPEKLKAETQPAPRGEAAASKPESSHAKEIEPDSTATRQPTYRRWAVLLLVLNLVLATSLVFLWFHQKKSSGGSLAQSVAIRDFWAQFFTAAEPGLKIIPADTGFALWQDLSKHDVSLGSYLSRQYLPRNNDLLKEVAIRRSTSPADVMVTTRLALIAQAFGSHYAVKYARDMDVHSLHDGNIAIIGSSRSNPWMELFEPQLNFVVDKDPDTGTPSIRNRAPRPGESSRYRIPTTLDTLGDEQQEMTSYGVVALLRSCDGSRWTVLLEGLNMQGTEAAGEFVTDPHALSNLLVQIHHTPGTPVTPFEALIRITSLPGAYANPKVIAYRTHSQALCKN